MRTWTVIIKPRGRETVKKGRWGVVGSRMRRGVRRIRESGGEDEDDDDDVR